MLDLFTIFSKGGIVLWYFQGYDALAPSVSAVNALIKGVVLQERGGNESFKHESLAVKYKLDNEFELVFVVCYQKILTLSYVDKLIDDVHREFRDKYKNDLKDGNLTRSFSDFAENFQRLRTEAETVKKDIKPQMKSYHESEKSKKTVASMTKSNKNVEEPKKTKKGPKPVSAGKPQKPAAAEVESSQAAEPEASEGGSGGGGGGHALDQNTIQKNIEKKFGPKKKAKSAPVSEPVSPQAEKKKGKVMRKWDKAGTTKDAAVLDYSQPKPVNDKVENGNGDTLPESDLDEYRHMVGQMEGGLQNIDTESEEDEEDEEEEEVQPNAQQQQKSSQSRFKFGVFNVLKGLVTSKTLTKEDIEPVLEKMKDHLVAKNVAVDIADKLCQSVATKLEGKILGTFQGVSSAVKQSLTESLTQILSPKRRIDILRDVMEAKGHNRPFAVTFCGVNGVGKSTNLAKICFWLIENNFRVLVAACDTFRAGAVEQLRTHTCRLNTLHPPDKHGGVRMVELYEKGYGKDSASIAMEAIRYARDYKFDVVLIDTAGRMQDNEPLMRALTKLIAVNQPDLVMFVGEALVGNEAVDQLVKFNQALADHSKMDNPRLIDGIVLTKFDTIDDKVGAAISMTYTTGQPIVFVGTGQTYLDLKNLNVNAVVSALLKA